MTESWGTKRAISYQNHNQADPLGRPDMWRGVFGTGAGIASGALLLCFIGGGRVQLPVTRRDKEGPKDDDGAIAVGDRGRNHRRR